METPEENPNHQAAIDNPAFNINHFFSDYPLPIVRAKIWEFCQDWVSGQFEGQDPQEQLEMIQFYSFVINAVELSYKLSTEYEAEEKKTLD